VNQNELNLREAWLRTEFFGQRLVLTAGRLDLTNYFDRNAGANDETTQFISDALVNNQMLGLAVNGTGMVVGMTRSRRSASASACSRATPRRPA
jgi:carbohydrate-selective porin OprB